MRDAIVEETLSNDSLFVRADTLLESMLKTMTADSDALTPEVIFKMAHVGFDAFQVLLAELTAAPVFLRVSLWNPGTRQWDGVLVDGIVPVDVNVSRASLFAAVPTDGLRLPGAVTDRGDVVRVLRATLRLRLAVRLWYAAAVQLNHTPCMSEHDAATLTSFACALVEIMSTLPTHYDDNGGPVAMCSYVREGGAWRLRLAFGTYDAVPSLNLTASPTAMAPTEN